ncbi:MAG: hypothetical protein KAI86_12775, partial [Desulfobacterales bacterium]|nr:hypothetical protein [Desulfobacterales bacterium]
WKEIEDFCFNITYGILDFGRNNNMLTLTAVSFNRRVFHNYRNMHFEPWDFVSFTITILKN